MQRALLLAVVAEALAAPAAQAAATPSALSVKVTNAVLQGRFALPAQLGRPAVARVVRRVQGRALPVTR